MSKYPRCPDCGTLQWSQAWPDHRHRPPCRFDGTDPATWSTQARFFERGLFTPLAVPSNPSPPESLDVTVTPDCDPESARNRKEST